MIDFNVFCQELSPLFKLYNDGKSSQLEKFAALEATQQNLENFQVFLRKQSALHREAFLRDVKGGVSL